MARGQQTEGGAGWPFGTSRNPITERKERARRRHCPPACAARIECREAVTEGMATSKERALDRSGYEELGRVANLAEAIEQGRRNRSAEFGTGVSQR
jgi:hypothetical protein